MFKTISTCAFYGISGAIIALLACEVAHRIRRVLAARNGAQFSKERIGEIERKVERGEM